MSGWIKLHRTLQKWGWKKNVNCLAVFIDLLLEANHEERAYMGVTIPRGSLTTSIKAIASRTGLSEMAVRVALKKLKATNEITSSATKKFTMISITKWDSYQLSNEQSNSPDNIHVTNRVTTNKKPRIKESKKDEAAVAVLNRLNEICSRSFEINDANLKGIKKRLSEGYTPDDVELVIQDKFNEWKDSRDMSRNLNPVTLFRDANFNRYFEVAKAALKPKPDPFKEFLLSAGVKPEHWKGESTESEAV